MEKEFVPYDESLALKELGFNEKCFGKYYYVREHEVYDPRKGEDFIFGDNNRIMLRDYPCNYGYDSNEVTVCDAPIFSQAFRFFREKYKLNSTPLPIENKWYFLISKTGETLTLNRPRQCYTDSYEEVELECLKKLIKICKNEI